jgi:hypothetical protein
MACICDFSSLVVQTDQIIRCPSEGRQQNSTKLVVLSTQVGRDGNDWTRINPGVVFSQEGF